MKFTGTARKVGDHIDTDAIIPARFLVTVDPKILGAQCLSGLEPDWARQVKNGDILVAGRNFGCGSSREHAPIAIIGAGLRAVIAHSFARIFYRNAFNTGLLLLEVGEEAYSIQHGDTLEIDPSAGRIRIVESGRETVCPPLPEHMAGILAAGGLVGYVGQRLKTGNNA